MTARRIGGLAEIAADYDAILCDQFGVLHDGRRAFPTARACLDAMRAAGKRVALVSNSGKLRGPNVARLEALGIGGELYDLFLSSGELARQHLLRALAEGELRPGSRALVVARDADRSALEGLGLTETEDAETADILIILGAAPETAPRASFRACFARLAARGVPGLCANPDLRMYAAGGVTWGAGALAADFTALGGRIELLGKPDPAIFRAALAALGADAARSLVIGDSAEHDIAGASAAGLDWLLVEGGVYEGAEPPPPTPNDRRGYVIQRLVW